MAVFPDKIVQKSSTDTVGEIAGQIGLSGTAPIIGGELVVARGQGNAQILTLDADGTPVIVGLGSANTNKAPEILLNFEDPTVDSPYIYASGTPFSTDAKFGAASYFSQPFLPTTPRPNPIQIQPSVMPLLGSSPWTLEFWIKSDPSEWITGKTSLLIYSHKDYLFGAGAFTVTLDGGNTSEPGGLGTDTSQTSGQAFGSIVFGLGGQFGAHGNPYVPTEGDIVSSRSVSVVDNDWHHVCFTHEGIGRYACFVDGLLAQRTVLDSPVDHNDSGTSGIPQPSGAIFSGVVNINDDDPFPGTEFFGARFKLDSVSLIPGVAKYIGQNAIPVPTAAFDYTPFATPLNSLSGLYDTDISLPVADGDVLQWHATDGAWKNSPAPAFNISGNDLGDIGDVTLEVTNLIADKEVLAWDTATQGWVNRAYVIDDLADVSLAGAVNNNVLKYDSGTSQWVPGVLSYSEITGRPQNILDLANDLDLDDIRDVFISGIAQGDILAYNATNGRWENLPAPPVNLASNSIHELSDVGGTQNANAGGDVLAWNDVANEWQAKNLQASDIDGAATKVSELTRDVSVSYWTNDAGYLDDITSEHLGDLSDLQITSPVESHVLVYRSGKWRNEYGPPANISTNSIGDLADVTYYQPFSYVTGELTIDGLGLLHWDDPSQPSNIRFDMGYRSSDQALGFEAIRDSDETGSSIYISRGGGVDLRSDVNVFRLRGKPDVTTNRPELRFETGDINANPSTGEFISIKMPANVLESVTYYLPEEDGDVGDVLATDGSGELSWVARVQNNDLGQLNDVDLATQLPADGNGLVYNAAAQMWVPGAVSNLDLSLSSINALQDVDTSTNAPSDGQALVWDNAAGEWVPGDVVTEEASPAVVWQITAGDGADYTFSGSGITNSNDPTLYVMRGQKYTFDKTFSGHAFELQELDGTTYTSGVTGTQPISGIGSIEWVVPMDAPAELKYQCTAHTGMTGTIYVLSEGADLGSSSINELQDVDTTTAAPASGQALVWDGSQWTPGNVAQDLSASELGDLGNVSSALPSGGQVLLWNGAEWLPGDLSSTSTTFSVRVEETVTAAAGEATFIDLGAYGVLYEVESDADAWVVLYSTAAERTADASRAIGIDPASGSGVLMEFMLAAGQVVRVSPSTNYFNADLAATSAIYAAIRNSDGTAQAGTQVSVKGYGIAAFDSVSGGTFGSG